MRVMVVAAIGMAMAKTVAAETPNWQGRWTSIGSEGCIGDVHSIEGAYEFSAKSVRTVEFDCPILHVTEKRQGAMVIETRCSQSDLTGPAFTSKFYISTVGSDARISQDGENWRSYKRCKR